MLIINGLLLVEVLPQTKSRFFLGVTKIPKVTASDDVWKHIWSTENESLKEETSSLKSNVNKSVAKKYL